MTSYIKVQRICKMCGTEFTARTTATQYCSPLCSKRAYKVRKREEKVEACNEDTRKAKPRNVVEVDVESREFLTVTQAAKLIGCSRRNIYYLIDAGQLKATNIMKKKTIINRADIDQLLNVTEPEKPKEYTAEECYTIGETQTKFGISGKALYDIIKRNDVPKFQKGKFVYVPKELIDKIFS